MKNIRYAICYIAHYLASKNLHRAGFLIISPSFQGKTSIARRISRELSGTVIIPPVTQTRLFDYLLQNQRGKLFILDDPSNWTNVDFSAAIQTIKQILDGYIWCTRSTQFSTAHQIQMQNKAGAVIFTNELQYDAVRTTLRKTGISERLVEIRTAHLTPETRMYIQQHYTDTCAIKRDFTLIAPRTLTTEEQEYIDSCFVGYAHSTVMWIARVLPPEQFAALKPYLEAGKQFNFTHEEVEFE